MDLSIQVKSLDLLIKLLRHDLKNMPPYGFKPNRASLREAEHCLKSTALIRSTPEAEGLSSSAVERFLREMDARQASVAAHELMLIINGKVVSEGYWAPYSAKRPYMIYSMSKSFTGTAVGIAVDEGILSLDETLTEIFPELTPSVYLRQHKTATVRQLLTMQSGSRFNEVGSMLDENWVKMFMESMPKFEPGTAFEYNSMNTYMLAAILVRRTGMPLTEYLRSRLFEPMGICDAAWERCPQGIEKGGWGLYLRLEDAAKLGQLYLQNGMWEGKRLLSEEWVKAATSKKTDTFPGDASGGYGYQIWVNRDNSFQFNGAFGQYVMVFPEQNAVVALYSGCADLFARGDLMKFVHAALFGGFSKPLPQNSEALMVLRDTEKSLSLEFPDPLSEAGNDAAAFDVLSTLLDKKEFRMEQNPCGIFPHAIQCVEGNFSLGTELVRFTKKGDRLYITLYEYNERNTFMVDKSGAWTHFSAAMRGERFFAAARGAWYVTEKAAVLHVMVPFTETPHVRLLTFTLDLSDGVLNVKFDEMPTIEKAGMMLVDLTGVSRTTFMRRLMPAIRKSGEHISETMNRLYTPTAKGVPIAQNDDDFLV
ncbi:MAG TPA: serine hydrolase [Clostridia bacterium]|nr:serine hydrolase [Clostridia bacterium]